MDIFFEWDEDKAERNLKRHGVPFDEAITSESSARAPPRRARGRSMKKEQNSERDPDMLDEYDFSGGERGKYAGRYARGTNVVVLDPDVARVFSDSESVN